MNDKKIFKIVKILDESSIVINAGLNYQMKIGDKFQILDQKASIVYDPQTNQKLGTLDLIKATVEVTEVYEKISVCSSLFISHNSRITNPVNFSGIFNEKPNNNKREKLNVNLSQVTGSTKSDRPIEIGDSVKKI